MRRSGGVIWTRAFHMKQKSYHALKLLPAHDRIVFFFGIVDQFLNDDDDNNNHNNKNKNKQRKKKKNGFFKFSTHGCAG